jgi:hypothetical protein
MKKEEYLRWFDDLIAAVPKPYRVESRRVVAGFTASGGEYIHADEASSWLAQAGAAIQAVLGEDRTPRKMWDAKLALIEKSGNPTPHLMDQFRGIFEGVAELLRGNRLSSLVDTIRAETEGNFLDQAEALRQEGRLILAAVLAGSALEVHLRQLCEKNDLQIKGTGSISAYQQALDSSRKANKEIISSTSSKSIPAWGGLRNDAAHRPDEFKAPTEEVRQMIEGIRFFIEKYN